MIDKINRCSICGRETSLSLKCHDCLKLTQSFHEWLRTFKKNKKEMSEYELKLAVENMESRIMNISIKTLSEWGY